LGVVGARCSVPLQVHRGCPAGALFPSRVAEITRQLRGVAGQHQIKGAKAGLTHTLGGGGGMACADTILTR